MATVDKPQYKVIGTRPVRHDGVEKVTGRAAYGADFSLPGMLYGRVMRSEHAHARIKSIDTSAAWEVPGVRLVLTGETMAARNLAWMPTLSFSNLSEDKHIDSVISSMRKKGIDARPVFPPLSELDPFDREPCKNAKRFSEISLNLPSFHDISDEEMDFVVDVVKTEHNNLE